MKANTDLDAANEPEMVEVVDDVFNTSAHTMQADLIGVIREACKALPDIWQRMPRDKQQDFLDSWDKQVKTIVETCVKHIASDGRPFVLATVDQVVFKKGIEAKLKIDSGPHEDGAPSGAHELADNTGQNVMIILPGMGDYEGSEEDKPVAEDDQPDLLDSASDDLFDDALQIIQDRDSISISALQKELKIGYNRAARLVDLMETAGYIGVATGTGRRPVL